MRKVRDQLYLGNITDASYVLQSSQSNITHMLSVFADKFLLRQLSQQPSSPGDFASLVTIGADPGEEQCEGLTTRTANPETRESPGGGPPASASPGSEIPAVESSSDVTQASASPDYRISTLESSTGDTPASVPSVGETALETSTSPFSASSDGENPALGSPGGGTPASASPVGEIPVLDSPGSGTLASASLGGKSPALDSPDRCGLGQDAAVKREVVRKTVPLRDIESENLLDHLESCLEFIEEAKKSGGDVLVHCLAGISRSASVITAYLMRTEKLSVNAALASLREVSGGVCPNDGFMEQLRMFEEMGYKVEKESPVYKQFTDSPEHSSNLHRLSFLDHVNNAVRGNSLRRSPFMNHVCDGPPPPVKRNCFGKRTKTKWKDSSGVPNPKKRDFIACLWRRSSNPK